MTDDEHSAAGLTPGEITGSEITTSEIAECTLSEIAVSEDRSASHADPRAQTLPPGRPEPRARGVAGGPQVDTREAPGNPLFTISERICKSCGARYGEDLRPGCRDALHIAYRIDVMTNKIMESL